MRMGLGMGITMPQYGGGGGTPAPTPATVDSVIAGTFAGGALPIAVTATGAVALDDVYWVLVPFGDPTPSAAEVKAGQASGGGAPTESGTAVWPTSINDTLVAGIARADYKIALIVDNGALSNVGVSGSVEVDTVAPVLSSALGSESSGDIICTVTSDEGNGTIHASFRLASDGVLSAADIIAGTGNAVSPSPQTDPTPTADGTNSVTFTTPVPGTYRVDIVQEDSYGNQSNVVSSVDVTIAAAAGPTKLWIGTIATERESIGNTANIDLTGVSAGDQLYIAVNAATGGPGSGASLTLETVGAILVGEVIAGATRCHIFKIICPAAAAGNAAADLVFSDPGGSGRFHAGAWKTTGTVASEPTYTDADTSGTASPLDVSGNVGNGVALACAAIRGGLVTGFTGLTEDVTIHFSSADWSYASATTVAATPRTMNFAHNNPGNHSAAIAVALS